jgi:hypothetical protein
MGYEVPENIVRLVFSDPSFDGLEVVCRLATVSQIAAAAQLTAVDAKNIRPEDAKYVENLIGDFANALVSWNCTRKGEQVPATREGAGSLDPLFTMQLVEAWLSGSGEILAEQAKDDAELEASIPPVEAFG